MSTRAEDDGLSPAQELRAFAFSWRLTSFQGGGEEVRPGNGELARTTPSAPDKGSVTYLARYPVLERPAAPEPALDVAPSLLSRLRDRKVVQWMVAYVAVAWIVLQAVDVLGQIWDWSPPVQRVICLVLGAGALPAFTLAWYHGERGRQHVCPMETCILTATLTGLLAMIWSFWLSTGG